MSNHEQTETIGALVVLAFFALAAVACLAGIWWAL